MNFLPKFIFIFLQFCAVALSQVRVDSSYTKIKIGKKIMINFEEKIPFEKRTFFLRFVTKFSTDIVTKFHVKSLKKEKFFEFLICSIDFSFVLMRKCKKLLKKGKRMYP